MASRKSGEPKAWAEDRQHLAQVASPYGWVTVTTINKIPFIAINDDMIDAVITLYTKPREQFELIFKEIGTDFKQSDPKAHEDLIKYIIDNKNVNLSTDEILKQTLAKPNGTNLRGRSAQQSVDVLLDNLLDNLKYNEPEKQKRSSRGEHVINYKVINVYKEIIDTFVKKQFNCSFDYFLKLTKIDDKSSICLDYYNPIDEITKRNIQEIMVVNIPDNYKYIDTNQYIYGVAILFLRYMAQVHMCNIYKVDKFQYPGSEYIKAIKDCVNFMNKNDIYVDSVALECWLKYENGPTYKYKIDTYKQSRNIVEMMLNNLPDRMAIWANQISAHYPSK